MDESGLDPDPRMVRYPMPEYVWYRGQRRRVYTYIPAPHQGHRHYVLRYKFGHEPVGAATMAFGERGQRKFIGVAVRADKVRRYQRKVKRTGKKGRPKTRRV